MIPTDGGFGTDHVVRAASDAAGSEGTLVLVSVLSGSLIDRRLSPPERGSRRRDAENRRTKTVCDQIARTAPDANCHVITLFGEVVPDTLLVVGNLAADGIVMGEDDPDLNEMQAVAPVPVLVVPSG